MSRLGSLQIANASVDQKTRAGQERIESAERHLYAACKVSKLLN